MKNLLNRSNQLTLMLLLFSITFVVQSCKQIEKDVEKEIIVETEKPDYFLLRPEVERAYGYSHAIKIGNDIKI